MKGIIGAICGDIIGSTREKCPIKTKNFELFPFGSTFTDDTILTLAIAKYLCGNQISNKNLIETLQYFGNKYPDAGYGSSFIGWLSQESPKPYGSWANGSAMRVSPCAWVADSLKQSRELAKNSAIVTHNHPEGIKGALAISDAIFLARNGFDKIEIKTHIENNYNYDLSRKVDEIRSTYSFDVSCKGSVPESIICFLQADNFEDSIRNAISLGGDADTQAAIAGSISAAYWDVPKKISENALLYLDDYLFDVFVEFEEKFMK